MVTQPATFEVTITSVDAVTAGETVTVAYEVTNTGDQQDTQEIEFSVDGTTEGTEAGVTLNGGETFRGQFSYDTVAGDAPGVEVSVASADGTATEAVTVEPPRTTAPWPMFQGGPARTGHHPRVTGPSKPVTTQWTLDTGDQVRSSPAVANGTVYVGSDDNSVYAIDASDGTTQWTVDTGDWVRSSPAVANGTVYVGSDDNSVYAIDASDGTTQWTLDTGGSVRSSPAVGNATAYVRSSDTTVHAIDAGDGSLVSASQDLAENPRNQGANVDLGAYELGPVSASASSVTVSSATATADGSDASTLTIELRDAQNNPISGLSDGDFTLSGLGDASVTTISEPSTGTYKADLTNTTAETVTVTVEVDGTTLNDTPTVDFVPGSPAAVSIGTISSPQTAGQQFDVPLTVEDANGNEVSSFSGDLNLTLAKGTSITPSTVTLESSSRSVSVTLTDAVSSEQITAEAVSDNSINGTSNTFDVEAGPAASGTVAPQPGDAAAGPGGGGGGEERMAGRRAGRRVREPAAVVGLDGARCLGLRDPTLRGRFRPRGVGGGHQC